MSGIVAEMLSQDLLLGVVRGREEPGPRALGRRSLLSVPFDGRFKEKMNAIKDRQWYR